MAEKGFLAPPRIVTSVSSRDGYSGAHTDDSLSLQHDDTSSRPESSNQTSSPRSEMSYLTVNHLNPPPSPTASSLGGETLGGELSRSRTNSFNTNRTRTNSTAHTEVEKGDLDDVSPEDALRPDKGLEKDFEVERNPFGVTPGHLNKLQNPKSLAAFKALGGLPGIERALRTDITSGLSVDETRLEGTVTLQEATKEKFTKVPTAQSSLSQDAIVTAQQVEGQFEDRIRVFKTNRLPDRKTDSIWVLLWNAYNDKILILLTAAAVISLALGLYETFSGRSSVDWVEGVAICVAIVVVVVVTAANDWQKERQFVKLNKKVCFLYTIYFLLRTNRMNRKKIVKSKLSDLANLS
jgi:Ca2+-transporting ATPase